MYRGYSWAIFSPFVLTLRARRVVRRGCVAFLASMIVGPSAAPGLGDTPFCLLVPGCFSLFLELTGVPLVGELGTQIQDLLVGRAF